MDKAKATSGSIHPSGKMVYSFLLQNEKGTVVEITNYGAIIMAIKFKNKDAGITDIVLGFDNPEKYWSEEYLLNYPYYGAAIGRYANRIKGSVIQIDGNSYHLSSQDGNCTLHGGNEGFDKKVWDVVSCENDRLEMQYISPDGEEGFPGELTVNISFALNDNNELSVAYHATTSRTTAVNLTHHSYFNLNGGKGRIDKNHFVKIYASKYLEQDEHSCATGRILNVAGTQNDFRNFKTTENIESAKEGIDVSFQLDKPGIDHIAAEAYCIETKLKLEVSTSEPVLHLYNAFASPVIQGKGGIMYTPFSGFCFETHVHPNAINVPSFPETVLRPGEVYRSTTIYRFKTV